ncbi:MAG: hypothetical protein HY675_27405 [Chloroflexi bacterium]|nr:hypothetical protein [Chloroflexota bacterium]
MKETEHIFDDLFRQTLDCVTELRSRQLETRAELDAARKKIAFYETLLSQTSDGLQKRNAELAVELEGQREKVAELRRSLSAILENYGRNMRHLMAEIEEARELLDSRGAGEQAALQDGKEELR